MNDRLLSFGSHIYNQAGLRQSTTSLTYFLPREMMRIGTILKKTLVLVTHDFESPVKIDFLRVCEELVLMQYTVESYNF
jgi:hypothetical protein